MSNVVIRGSLDYVTMALAATATSSDLDKLVVASGSNTATLFTFASANSVPIGTIEEISANGLSAKINLMNHTLKGIAGGAVTGGAKLVAQSTTGYLIAAAGTLTANPVIGVAISAAAASGEKFEWIPYTQNDAVVLA